MAKFKYTALSNDGKRIEGVYECNLKDDVIKMIESNGYYPLKIEEIKEKTNMQLSIFQKVTVKDISIFCRQLYTMLDARVSINKALNIMSKQLENKILKEVTASLEDSVNKGEMLSEAMRKHKNIFPNLLLAMVKSGEISGNLSLMMLRMSVHYERENKINNKIKSAMIYPAVLSVVAIAAVMVIMTFVMPTFMEMFNEESIELPTITKALLSISSFLQGNFIVLSIVTAVVLMSFSIYIKTEEGTRYMSILKLKIPVISSLNKKIIVSRLTRTLSTLLSSGVPLIQSLPVIADVLGNTLAKEALNNIKERVVKGEELNVSFRNERIFPEMLSSMIAIGEETGKLDEILNKIADFYDDELEQAIMSTTALIEPLLIVVMGLAIGFIVLAIMIPMFNMYSAI